MIIEYNEPLVSITKSQLTERIQNSKMETAMEIIKDLERFVDEKEKGKLIGGRCIWFVNSDDLTDYIASLKQRFYKTPPKKDQRNSNNCLEDNG